MKVLRHIVGSVLYLGQVITMALAAVMQLIAQHVFMRANRFILKWLYYRTFTLARRKVMGEPMWKDFDQMLGIEPPPAVLERLKAEHAAEYERVPKCGMCGLPQFAMTTVPGPASGEEISPPPPE